MTLLAMLGSMSGLVSGIGTGFQTAGTLATQAFQAVSDFVNEWIIQPLKDFWEWLKEAWAKLEEWGGIAWEYIGGLLDEWLIQPLKTFWGWMEEGWAELETWASDAWSSIGDWWDEWIATPISDFWESMETAWEDLKGWSSESWESIKSSWEFNVSRPLGKFWGWLGGAWEDLKEWGEDTWNSIGDWWNEWVEQPIDDFWLWLDGAWQDLKGWGEDTWESIGNTWNEYIGGPIGRFFTWMDETWTLITDGIKIAWEKLDFGIVLDGAWDFLLDLINDPVGTFKKVGNAIGEWASGLGDTFGGLVKTPINAVIGVINDFFDSVDFSFTVENPFTGTEYSIGMDLSDWDIPELAKGGIVNKPTLALIGEDGPEAVVPLSQRNNPNGIGMGGSTFNITVNAGGITDRTDKRSLAREIGNMIQQEMARNIGGATMRGRY